MRLERLYVENFRGYEKREFLFKENFTVIAGDNGSGKTALLEALSVALGGWLYAFDGIEGTDKRNIYQQDKRFLISKINSAVLVQIPTVVECTGIVEGENITWRKEISSRNGRTTHGGLFEIKEIAANYNRKIYANEDADITLPIVAYYSAARLWNEPIQRTSKFEKDKVRTSGYKKSLLFSNSIKDTMDYIDKIAFLAYKKDDAIYMNQMKIILGAIEESFKSVAPKATVWYNTKVAELCVTDENGTDILYSKLSDGYRCVISLVVDICRRMATLNPQLNGKDVLNVPGVVLIDEIDLHLHPIWQKNVVADLKRIFPEVQFIATTHSPFIIQSLNQGELLSLTENQEYLEYQGESIEDIAENVMGVANPKFSSEQEKKIELAKEFYSNLDNATSDRDIQQIEDELNILTAKYSNDVAYYAFLEQKLLEKKVEMEIKNETD